MLLKQGNTLKWWYEVETKQCWLLKIGGGFARNWSSSGSLQRLLNTDSITNGSVGNMQNICWRLITELDVFGREALGPWSFPDNLYNIETQYGQVFFALKWIFLHWYGKLHLLNLWLCQNTRKRERRHISMGKKGLISQKQFIILECLATSFANA